ncbi:aminopeptidase-like protein 3 [Dinothrombium tinctorium]|uniref:Cytosol aminopeptidase n=1 Tax=Dinothrombium tinctorium TaxID=1965070 RepID=A0A3S3PH67_9ACAR|nr:aminopeptidase-like protein 3 [Dinothrombium tinctorium]RWS12372.1 aminopeptidase-like protein 3 [Dinothrombium tinctorium]
MKKALILGVFNKDGENGSYLFTKAAEKLNENSSGKLKKYVDVVGPIKKGKTRIFYDLTPHYDVVSLVGLGSDTAGYNENEELEENRENVRAAVASGLRSIRELFNASVTVDVDNCNDPEAASEGAFLAAHYFDELKQESLKKKPVTINLLNSGLVEANAENVKKWERGELAARGQNIARRLAELPSNYCTPTKFAEMVSHLCEKHKIEVHVRDKAWIESQKMGAFLSVSRGSDEPPVFLELHYNNLPNTKPVVLVGKGICFDSGGISLKPAANMGSQRADMGGAACVVSTIITLAAMEAKVNVIALTPLCENLPSGKATKPSDVVTAMNGKTIQVDNTDAEGRLVLADALCYAHKFEPELILDIATLTSAVKRALGPAAAAVFTTSTKHFNIIHKCGTQTGDRVWRLPLFNFFTKHITNSQLADLSNVSKKASSGGGSCIAAAFLKEFVTIQNWLHLDIAGVKENKDEVPYIGKGMAGRPVRTLINFVLSIYN